MNYQEAINYLVHLTKFGFNFGLDRIQHLMSVMGNPDQRLRTIHVGGTNGKGSTCVMISNILAAAGYRVGLFTSPHLHSYTERYVINGCPISEEKLAQLISRTRPFLEQMAAEGHEHPTEFEVCTAIAFEYFDEEKVDFAIFEVGLGGLIDSTNIVNPLAAVITNVGMDHMDYLGNSLPEIAKIKAGIVKEQCPLITAATRTEVLQVIREECLSKNAPFYQVGTDLTYSNIRYTDEGVIFFIKTLNKESYDLFLPLRGEHQVTNAATAVLLIDVLCRYNKLNISQEAIRTGLEQISWPARLELIGENPRVLIDVAHNYDGAVKLRQALQELFIYDRLILIISMLGDKEREKVVCELAPLSEICIVTKPDSPRAGDWRLLAEEAAKYSRRVEIIEDIREAVKHGLSLAGSADLVCVTGSFYMVAEAREELQANLKRNLLI